MDKLRDGQGRVVGLNRVQKDAVIEGLYAPNATFFTFKQLQE